MSRPGALSHLLNVLEEFCNQAATIVAAVDEPDIRCAVLTATMEIAENITQYAYALPAPTDWLQVKLSLFADRVEIVLCDEGDAFDPRSVEARDGDMLWHHPHQRGWGIFLAQQAVDELRYAREDGVNVWRLVVAVPPNG